MSKYDQINSLMRDAMRQKNPEVVTYTRNLKSKISEYLVANNLPRDIVSDDAVEVVTVTYCKSLRKGAAELEKSDRDAAKEMAASYKAEADFCSQFGASDGISADELRKLVDQSIAEVGSDNFGRLMGHVMKTNKGLDGTVVRELIKEILSGQ